MLRYLNFAPHHGSALRDAYFTTSQPNRLYRLYHQPAHAILLRQRFTHKGGTGISTSCPSPTTSVLGLGPDLPWADEPSPGNLGLSTGRFLACLSLLIPAFSLLYSPPVLPLWLQPVHYAPLPLACIYTAFGFGAFLPLRNHLANRLYHPLADAIPIDVTSSLLPRGQRQCRYKRIRSFGGVF